LIDRRALLLGAGALALPRFALAQPAQQITLKAFTWLWSGGTIAALSGFAIGPTAAEIASTAGQTGQYFAINPIPTDFPDPLLIWASRIMCGNSSGSDKGEIDLWVDPLGTYFRGSRPPGQETSPPIKMAHINRLNRVASVPPTYQFDQLQALPAPVSFSKAHDVLVLYVSPETTFDWVGLNLYYQ
jgi:hypothetical protein